MRSALWLPLFDELADPAVVVRLAAEAEEAGRHGLFVWDQLHWRAPVREVADPWITLAAVATVTERLLLGPMVTPLARRRPAGAGRRAGQRPVRPRALRHRQGVRRPAPRRHARRAPGAVAAAGATWWLTEFDPATVSVDEVRAVLRDGPARPG